MQHIDFIANTHGGTQCTAIKFRCAVLKSWICIFWNLGFRGYDFEMTNPNLILGFRVDDLKMI